MKKEQIEQAARKETEMLLFKEIKGEEINTGHDNYEAGREDAIANFGGIMFAKGAGWRINSVWHDLSGEMPECNRHVVNEDWFDFIAKDEKHLARIIKKYPFKQWAYVDDLLPNGKEVSNESR